MAAASTTAKAADTDSDEELQNVDICRVCRCEATPDHPLFYPCLCTGSIKYIHQDCLVEWLKYSKKEYCELCKHKFQFTPIYADNMPRRLPISILFGGLFSNLWKGVRAWWHYSAVVMAWLVIVPVFASRVHQCLFQRSVLPLSSLPSDLVGFENIANDLLQGVFLVAFTLCAFIALVWLREQIGLAAPHWLPADAPGIVPPLIARQPPAQPAAHAAPFEANQDLAVNPNLDAGADTDQEPELNQAVQAGDGLIGSNSDADVDDNGDWYDGSFDDEDEEETSDSESEADDAHPRFPQRRAPRRRRFAFPSPFRNERDQGARNGINEPGPSNGPDRRQRDQNNHPAAANAEAEPVPPANENVAANEAEEAQRNQQELERVAEELTWERLLGLDGSWVFLEHVLWVISLNTVCVILFVFAPYNCGYYLLERFGSNSASAVGTNVVMTLPNGNLSIATTVFDAASSSANAQLSEEYQRSVTAYLLAKDDYLNVTASYLRLLAARTEADTEIHKFALASLAKVEIKAVDASNTHIRAVALGKLALFRDPAKSEVFISDLNTHTSNLTRLATSLAEAAGALADLGLLDVDDKAVMESVSPALQLLESSLSQFVSNTAWLDGFDIESQNQNQNQTTSAIVSDVDNSTLLNNTESDSQSAAAAHEDDTEVALVNSLERLGYLGATLITLIGYIAIGFCLLVAYLVMTLPRGGEFWRRAARLILLAYIVVKVALLVTLEIGMFPLCVGWWIDICTLPLFGSTWSDRAALFGAAPGTVCFLHWIVGMIYVFYFASFVILLREVLRPGVLWFLRNLNDPEFNPIHEMIVQPASRHVQRFVFSCVLFGTSVIFVFYAPVRLVRITLPAFLPFNVHHSDAPVNEISYSFLVLNLILPVLLEHVQLRAALKTCVRRWCYAVGWALDLRSYLLGEPNVNSGAELDQNAGPEAAAPAPAPAPAQPQVHENLAARHRAMLMDADAADRIDANAEIQAPYAKPSCFTARIVALVGFTWISLSAIGTLLLTVPVATGRALIAAWLSHVNGMRLVTVGDELADADAEIQEIESLVFANRSNLLSNLSSATPEWTGFNATNLNDSEIASNANVTTKLGELASAGGDLLPVYVHELYTTALGLYIWWLVIRLCSLAEEWYKKNATEIVRSVKTGCVVAAKAGIVCGLMLVVMPILIGLLFDLVVIIPLRVAANQTPIYNILNHWTFGILHMKILAALTAIGPQWWLRDELELLYANGLRNIRLAHTLSHLCYPLMASLGLALAVPYVLARTVFPLFSDNLVMQHYVLRNVYPSTLLSALLIFTVYVHIRQIRKLYEHIRNERYLIGQRLVNYEQRGH